MSVVWKLYQRSLVKYPILTQSVQTGLLMGTGDLISQTIIEKKTFTNINWLRTAQFASVGLFVGGPGLRTWYGILNKYIGSHGTTVVLKKVALDQFVFAPVFIGVLLSLLFFSIENNIAPKSAKPKRKAWAINCVIEPVVQVLDEITVTLRPPTKTKQQVSQLANKSKGGLMVVSTGNWGCGSSHEGNVQLKVILQWLAASVAGVPGLTYYTMGHEDLTTLDTLCRILVDRKWTVKDLAQEMLNYATQYLHGKVKNSTLFEDLIGVERTE